MTRHYKTEVVAPGIGCLMKTASSKLTATLFGVRNPNAKNALDWEIQGDQVVPCPGAYK